MNIQTISISNSQIAEILVEEIIIASSDDGLNLLGDLYYQGFDRVLLYEKNITPEFFDLKNGMAGEVLQKFSNYRVRLAIVGNFEKYTAKSIRDFIFESNKRGHINFVASRNEAVEKLVR